MAQNIEELAAQEGPKKNDDYIPERYLDVPFLWSTFFEAIGSFFNVAMVVLAVVLLTWGVTLAVKAAPIQSQFQPVFKAVGAASVDVATCVQSGDCRGTGAYSTITLDRPEGHRILISHRCGASQGTCSAELASLTISPEGVITGTATTNRGLTGQTYMLTPFFVDGEIHWFSSGTCKQGLGLC